jgi:hypothetical protein
MEHDIAPEPSADERQAIEDAVARLLAEPGDPRSAWWREGVRETTSPEED